MKRERQVVEIISSDDDDDNDSGNDEGSSSDESIEVMDSKKSKKDNSSDRVLSSSQRESIHQVVKCCSEQFNIFKKDDFSASYGLFLNTLLEEIVKTREYRMVRSSDGFSNRLSKLLSGDHLTLLPKQVVERIFSFLHPEYILTHRPDTVCSNWYTEITNIWKKITKFIAPAINVEKYDTETLKEYCLAKKRAFYRQQKKEFTYIHLELEKEEYPPSYEYDPIKTCETIVVNDEISWREPTFFSNGTGKHYDSFRSCEGRSYLLIQFDEVSGYHFNLNAPYYVYFTYSCQYEYEEDMDDTSFTIDLSIFANDDEEDDDDFISPVDSHKIDWKQVKKIGQWLGMKEIKDLKDWFFDFLEALLCYDAFLECEWQELLS